MKSPSPIQAKPTKKPTGQTVGIKNTKIPPEMLAFAKSLVLENGATDLRKCSVEAIAKKAIYHDKMADKSWLKWQIERKRRHQWKRYLRNHTEPRLPPETIETIVAAALEKNFEKSVRKAGFDPDFKQFLFVESYLAFQQIFGKQAFYFLKKNLKNPAEISPFWASQFMVAARNLGEKQVQSQSDPYVYVTSSSEFRAAIQARQGYSKVFTNLIQMGVGHAN